MAKASIVASLLLCGLTGCVPRGVDQKDQQSGSSAARHFNLAEKLERDSSYREATFEYTMVAERFPASEHYPSSVRKAALLYANPLNPSANDSAASFWFAQYLSLPLPSHEREVAGHYVKLLDLLKFVERSGTRKGRAVDSLDALSRRQAFEISVKNKRILELETEIARVSEELKKMREIDIQTHRSRK